MSSNQAQHALRTFATSAKGRAVVLKGDWGTGKTFTWNKVLKTYRSNFNKPKYSYLSLFGLSSLVDVKSAIFINSISMKKAGDLVTLDSVKNNMKNQDFSDSFRLGRWISNFGKDVKIPFVGLGNIVENIQFASISDTLICIDDYERRSNSLSGRDLLGLISNLIEAKNCTVLLILNTNALNPSDEFFNFNEKIFDYEISYDPTVKECIDIVFPQIDPQYSSLKKNIEKLEIKNIRLMKKIDLFYDLLKPHLAQTDQLIFDKAMLTLPLALLAIYQPSACPVDIDLISVPGNIYSKIPVKKDDSAAEAEKNARLTSNIRWLASYGYSTIDELDLAILSLVNRGYADEERLKIVIDEISEITQKNKDMQLLSLAWEKLNSGLHDNQDEVIEAFETALSACLPKMRLNDVNSVCELYENMGLPERVSQIVNDYFEHAEIKDWDKKSSSVFERLNHSLIQEKIKDFRSSQVKDVPISELMNQTQLGENFTQKSFAQFLMKDAEEFYRHFKNHQNPEIFTFIYNCLELGNISYGNTDSNKAANHIFMSTYRAVERLSNESRINKFRLKRFYKYDTEYRKRLSDNEKLD